MQWQHLQWSQYINIYLHRESCNASFIHYLIVTAKNLIELVVFFYFSVYADQQRNNIYLEPWCKYENINLFERIYISMFL